MSKIFTPIIAIFLIFVSSGCSISNRDNSKSSVAQARNNIYLLSNKLSFYGVNIYQETNLLKLALPNRIFFTKNSANFTGNAYEALDLIFSLVGYYKESTIVITGYSGNDDEISGALAAERARRIMGYLWRSNIDSNFVYASSKNIEAISSKQSLANCTLVEVKY
jgi:outer membrane protein OmpA-like peptidoglycan-associated protein